MNKKFKIASLVMSSMLVVSSVAAFAGSSSTDYGTGSEKSRASLSASSTVATATTDPYVSGVPTTSVRLVGTQDVGSWVTGNYSATATPSATGVRGGGVSANSRHQNGSASTSLSCYC